MLTCLVGPHFESVLKQWGRLLIQVFTYVTLVPSSGHARLGSVDGGGLLGGRCPVRLDSFLGGACLPRWSRLHRARRPLEFYHVRRLLCLEETKKFVKYYKL